jgi:chromate transporter
VKPKLIRQLFTSFFKIGLVAFGGGYTVIPLLQREAVESRQWVTSKELAEIMAISQTMPGIIMVNSATMVGSRIGGFWGGLTATTAAIAPTFIITLLVTVFFWGYTDNSLIKKALTGILLGVTALIIYSITTTWKSVVRTYFDIFLVILSSALLLLFKINVVLVIIGTGALGFAYQLFRVKGGRK